MSERAWETAGENDPAYHLPTKMDVYLLDGVGPDLEPRRMLGFEFWVPAPDEKPIAVGYAVDPQQIDGLIAALQQLKGDLDG